MKKNSAVLDLESKVAGLEAKVAFATRYLDQYDMFVELVPYAVADVIGYKKPPKFVRKDKDGRHYTMGRVQLAVDARIQTLTISRRGLSMKFAAYGGKLEAETANYMREFARRIRQGAPTPFVDEVDLFSANSQE